MREHLKGRTLSPRDYDGGKSPAQLRREAGERAMSPEHRERMERARRNAIDNNAVPDTGRCHQVAEAMRRTNPAANGKVVQFGTLADGEKLVRADGRGSGVWDHHSVYMEPPDPRVYDPDQMMVFNNREEFVAAMFQNDKVVFG